MRERTYRWVIGVMGGSQCSEAQYQMARRVGQLIAGRGAVLLCGGMTGVMTAAAQGAKEVGGLTLGIMPGANARESPPNPYIDIALFTGLREGRNYVNVCACDGMIAIGGGYGTLSEIALALRLGKPLVLLESWQLRIEGQAPDIPMAQTPEEAVEKLWAMLVEP